MKKYFLYQIMVASFLIPLSSLANPIGGNVTLGNATIQSNGNLTTITQNSNKAIINWQSFNINQNEHTHFAQPGTSAIALNRIHDQNPSEILGHLTADGQIMLINPNGMLFGQNAKVDVGGLVATTADISDQNFSQGNYIFDQAGKQDAAIVNEGSITTYTTEYANLLNQYRISSKGLIALMAPVVENKGQIIAEMGHVALAGGETFTVDLYGDGLIQLDAGKDFAQKLQASNSGKITALDGVVKLSTAQAQNVVDNLINMDGVIDASAFRLPSSVILESGGQVQLTGKILTEGKGLHDAGDISITAKEKLDLSGDLSATAYAKGGDISLKAEEITLGGNINVSGNQGSNGNIHIQTPDFKVTEKEASTITSALENGGHVHVQTQNLTSVLSNIETQSSQSSTLEFENKNGDYDFERSKDVVLSLADTHTLIGREKIQPEENPHPTETPISQSFTSVIKEKTMEDETQWKLAKKDKKKNIESLSGEYSVADFHSMEIESDPIKNINHKTDLTTDMLAATQYYLDEGKTTDDQTAMTALVEKATK